MPGKPLDGCYLLSPSETAFLTGNKLYGDMWTQAVWRYVQTCGLVKAYREQQGVHKYIRQLLALPFMPAQHIRVTFLHLKARANSPQLQDLVDNMGRQWFRNQLFKVHDWFVFQRTIRTNNDVECNKLLCFLLFLN